MSAGSGTVKASREYIREKDFKASIVDLAVLNGWLVYSVPDSRWVYPNRTGVGFPDLVLVGNGRLLFVEVKTEKGKISPAQKYWHEELKTIRCVDVNVWRPSDWEQIKAILEVI